MFSFDWFCCIGNRGDWYQNLAYWWYANSDYHEDLPPLNETLPFLQTFPSKQTHLFPKIPSQQPALPLLCKTLESQTPKPRTSTNPIILTTKTQPFKSPKLFFDPQTECQTCQVNRERELVQ